MIIQVVDILSGATVKLTASFITDHPASHYGQPVMYIDEWGDCIPHQNWVLGGATVIEATDVELKAFKQWHKLIELMSSECR